ncbi:sorting nexin-24-like [Lycorma delicatula]|uniref:sorting nexin-24-like n=1 Tax=Lycorma delicatula TaxID=130591 RepID=UPI003F5144FC
MNEIYISKYRLVEDSKPHYVYTVEVLSDCVHHKIDKRYSAFHSLHRELRKSFKTPPFPPKRVRCTQPKVLEQRRLGLEQYLQAMFKFGPSRSQVLSFLGIPKVKDNLERNRTIGHQPVFRISTQTECKRSNLPDIVAEGVINAIYKHSKKIK